MRLIVSGDTIINHRVSPSHEPGFLEVVELLRSADVTHTQFEQLVHDFGGPETYPAGDGSWGWFHAPPEIVEELRWLGIDIVSLASNHALDYSYGGLRQTWAALEQAGIPHAGTGEDLAAARAPAFLDTPHGRIALVSACSTFAQFYRAGAARADMRGRPGVNPQRWHWRADRASAEEIMELAARLGQWVTVVGDEVAINPPGLHNTLWRVDIDDTCEGITTVPDPDDLAGNMAAIRHGLSQADFVIAHLHCHEYDAADGRMFSTPCFAERFARAAVDEGAHLVVVQGSHAPVRGIEVYAGRPIFYDPGDLMRYGKPRKVPADFYLRWGFGREARQPDAGPPEAYRARRAVFGWGDEKPDFILSPDTIYGAQPGFVLPVCELAADGTVEAVTLHPLHYLDGGPMRHGLPAVAHGRKAVEILDFVAELSAPYGTRFERDGDVARLVLAP